MNASVMTLARAVHLAKSGKSKSLARAASYLAGCPVGGWPETKQAMARIAEELPARSLRAFSSVEFIIATYVVDGSGRWAVRS